MKSKSHYSGMAIMLAGLVSVITLLGFNSLSRASEDHIEYQGAVVVEGPMPIEAQEFANNLEHVNQYESGVFTFYEGYVDGYPVVVVQTEKGMENTAAATALAIVRYTPVAVINQGTSGGHDAKLHVFDIVLGKRTVNIGSLKTETRGAGGGIHPTQWKPMDLMATQGSAGESKDAENIHYYYGDGSLLAAAEAVKSRYKKGNVVKGTIGSADFWNNEIDRINWLHETYGTSVEEMEGASAAQVADEYNIPFLDIRILSNNQTNGDKYNPNTAAANQAYVYEVVKEIISRLDSN